MTNRTTTAVLSAFCAILLVSCGGNGGDSGTGSGGGEIKAEQFCNRADFVSPMRETFVFIDAKAMTKTSSAKEFAAKNQWLRDVLLEVADPVKSLASEFMEPRERVTIIVLPPDGSTGSRAFTGCIPGLSAAERARMATDASAVKDFFTGTNESKLEDAQAKFRTLLIGGLQSAASQAAIEQGRQTADLGQTPLMEAFRASQGMLDTAGKPKRFILVSDLSGIATLEPTKQSERPPSEFLSGIAAARRSAIDFGHAEIFLIQPPGSKLPNKNYLRGFFLAQGGDLLSQTVGKPGLASAAPVKAFSFTGQANYPSGSQQLRIELAADAGGKLVYSWMILLGDEPQPMPLAGNMRCSSASSCTVTSAPGKFSQSWSPSPGGEPEFANDLPFGGMRNFRLSFENGTLTGKVSDPAVGNVGDGKDFISVSAKAREEGLE